MSYDINDKKQLSVVFEDDVFLYPFMIIPLFLQDENIDAVTYAMESDTNIIVCPTKESHEGEREYASLYDAGVVGSIIRKVVLPDKRIKILFQGLTRARLVEKQDELPLRALVETIEPIEMSKIKMAALLEVVRENVRSLARVSNLFPPDLLRSIEDTHDVNRIIDLVCSIVKMPKDRAYEMFIEVDSEKRAMMLINFLIEDVEAHKLQREIRTRVNHKMDQINKEYFLKEQLKEIQQELGEDNQRNEEIEEYRKELELKKEHMSDDAYSEISKQIDRFARSHLESSDSVMLQNYIESVLEIPFGVLIKKHLKVDDVEQQLNRDHFSLTKPKKRIVEFFAVKEMLELRGKSTHHKNSTILCFAGPPGVGKTSLANSIATALKRPLVRIALGGLEDVNELRGHRRTYVGAMPGRIVQGLIDAKSMNPIVVLDEIDKVGMSHRGDPTAALLEILDPEQNSNFRDYFLNFHLDLSQVMFIATANDVGRIPVALRDRMEFIPLSSYTPQEKFEIATRYLLPQEIKKHGLRSSELTVSKAALKELIYNYTREAGVRNLRRRLADIVRKSVKCLLEDSQLTKVSVTLKNLKTFMDKKVFEIRVLEKDDHIGVVNGLAWTAVGGDMLSIEAIRIRGKGAMQLTGSLGDVMKESARIALSVVKSMIDEGRLVIDHEDIPKNSSEKEMQRVIDASEIYKRYDLHIHVPDGATPKDGPSAGIALCMAIASVLSSRKVRASVAMTGEVSLTGVVLPIGGLKEKMIAAHKAGIKKVILPQKNYDRDLDDIPQVVLDEVEIVGVSYIDEVLEIVLIDK